MELTAEKHIRDDMCTHIVLMVIVIVLIVEDNVTRIWFNYFYIHFCHAEIMKI